MTGSDIQRLLDYLESDRLGYQYTAVVARRAKVSEADAAAALPRLQAEGYVDSMGEGPQIAWQITPLGIDRVAP